MLISGNWAPAKQNLTWVDFYAAVFLFDWFTVFFSVRPIFAESSVFARSSSERRRALIPRPARLMKYVSIRRPEIGPLGDTFFEARVRAIVEALLVKSPSGGCVESVFTFATHRFFFATGIFIPAKTYYN